MKIINRILLAGLFGFLMASSAFAATFTVKNTLDDGSSGSLRWAITQANANSGFDTIDFHIAPQGLASIQLSQDLPVVTGPVMIDGWSQTGKPAVSVEIRGTGSVLSSVLRLEGSGSTVRGLAINSAYTCLQLHRNNHQIYGNFIGLGLDGETQLSCEGYGILAEGIPSVDTLTIGGEGSKRNVIMGLTSISISGKNIQIKNNIIGMTVSGNLTNQMPNHALGIKLKAYNAEVDSNYIGNNFLYGSGSGNSCWEGGVCIAGVSKNVKITNNFIGVGLDGESARPNKHGITLFIDAKDVVISNNVISGNEESGILVRGDEFFSGASSNALIADNIIGLSSKGDWVVNQSGPVYQPFGIHLKQVDGMTIGKGNTVSGNITGVAVSSSGAVKVEGNTIGLGLDRTTPYPNQSYGVRIAAGALHEIKNNMIAHNGIAGVSVTEFADNVSILNNSIFKNESAQSNVTGLGIDLIPDGGVTLNDEGDGDSGSNDLMNFPVLHEATYSSKTNELSVELSLDTPGTALIQFFANSTADLSGHGEGETFLGEANVSPGSHTVKIQLPFSPIPGLLKNISATATVDNKTSEFSGVLSRVEVIGGQTDEREGYVDKWIPLKSD